MSKAVFDENRPLSWSAISSFEWDPEQWWNKYCLHGKCTREFCSVVQAISPLCPVVATSKEMEFGKKFAQSIEDGKCSVPELVKMLQSKIEHPFKVMFGKIALIGFADSFCHFTKRKLEEVKTGKKKWDQERADQHGQITMYLLMNYLINKIHPEDVVCRIHWLSTQDNGDFSISFVKPIKVYTFYTKRTMKDILDFGVRINKTHKAMKLYAKNHD